MKTLLSLALLSATALGAIAATFTVLNTNDSGSNSLRLAIISANSTPGLDTIAFSITGAVVHTISPVTPLPTITEAVTIDGYAQPGSGSNYLAIGDNAQLKIELSGAILPNGVGLTISGGNCTVRGLVINRFSGGGIAIFGGGSNVITGNFIGLAANGSNAVGNAGAGVLIVNAPGNLIGGTNAGLRNLISGNGDVGVEIIGDSATNNLVRGNYIGPDLTGAYGPGNFNGGIYVQAAQNTIGGATPGAGNVISANDYIGLNLDGGSCCGENVVQGNYIGTTADGQSALANADAGIEINCHSNLIGGTVPGAGNLISGNATTGIDVAGNSGNLIQGNFIGTNPGGTNLGNQMAGVLIRNSLANTVGGTIFGAGNSIAFNGNVGVGLSTNGALCWSNAILSNLIFQNAGPNIDLNLDGATANDPGDADTGPNNLQNFPVLTSATTAGSTTVRGTLNSIASRAYRLEFFGSPILHGTNVSDARSFLGSIDATTDGAGNANFNSLLPVAVAPGFFVCATATDPLHNTSELSPPVSASLALGIGSLSASHGAVGSTITISGTNFSTIAGDNVVYFGAVRATVVSASPASLVVVVPPGGSYGPVTITLAGLTAASKTPFVPTFPTAHSISFAPKFNLPPGAAQSGMAIGDLDGDGRPDLVVAVQTNSASVFIYPNVEPGGNLNASSFAVPMGVSSPGLAKAVALADIDGDGLLDVILLKTGPDRVEVLLNLSTPGMILFNDPVAFASLGGAVGALAIADVDGDGLPDVIATGMTNNQIAVFRNTSTPGLISLQAHVDFAAGTAPVALAVADLDGDGRLDIVAADAHGVTGTLSVLRNVGLPGVIDINSFATAFSLTNGLSGGVSIVLADFDGDGRPDIAVALASSSQVALYRKTSPQGVLNPGSFAPPVNLLCPGAPGGLAVADLDGDGKLELICANPNSMVLSVFWNISNPGSLTTNSFAPRLDLPVASSSFAVAAADFDLDGKPDLVALGNTPDSIALLRNQGNEPYFLVNSLPPSGDTVVVLDSATVQIFNRFTNGPIYYTLDGSPPNTSSARYTNSFVVRDDATLRAIAFNSNTLFFAEAPTLNLVVHSPPFLILQPQGQIADTGDDVLFVVEAGGSPPLRFQWVTAGTNIPGATNSFLLLTNIDLSQAGTYYVFVANAYGAYFSAPSLLIRTAPSLLSQPGSTNTGVGASVTFSASATNAIGPIAYQWRRNGANLAGATNSSLTIANIQLTDGATYTVVVSSPGGTVTTSPAQLLIVSVPSQAGGDNFTSASALSGNSGSIYGSNTLAKREFGEPLHAGKPGSNSVWYTWTPATNGIATFSTIGSTFDTLLAIYTGSFVTNLTTIASDDDSGGSLASKFLCNVTAGVAYRIAVDGFNGAKGRFLLNWSLEQTNVTIPVITCHPASQTVLNGGTASFNVSVTPSNLIYQWLFNGSNIAGASNSFLVRTNVQAQDVGFYNARVTGPANRAVDSLAAILEISTLSGTQSREKPDDLYPACGGAFALLPAFAAASASASSVAMGSIGSQILVPSSTNNLADCNTTNCGGISRGTRYLELTPAASGAFIVDTSGSVPHTRMWLCAKGTNNLDLTRTFVKCDADSAPDGRSSVRFDAEGGRTYQVWIGKLDNTNGVLQLNWKLGLPPVLYAVSADSFVSEGTNLTLSALATNIIAPDALAPLAAPALDWYFDGTNHIGSGAAVTVSNVTTANAGQYTITASNAIGTTSAIVRVEVHGPATSPVLHSGGGIELFADDSTEACPGGHPAYQWYLNGHSLSGQTNRSLILRNVQAGQAGAYSVTVSNCLGLATYTASTVAVTVDVGFVALYSPGGQVTLRWQTTPGKHYRVQSRPSLDSSLWMALGPDLTAATTSLTATDQIGGASRFYRILLLDP